MVEQPAEHEDRSITQVLDSIRAGSLEALDELIPLVYEQLRGIARSSRSHRHTLQPTELVHEAWMKLAPHLDRFEDRQHFFAAAALSIRHVLADYARAKKRQKRGGGVNTITFDENVLPAPRAPVDLIVVHECLEELERLNPRHARVIEMRIFGGLTNGEVAEVLQVSRRTVEADWFMARAWMCAHLSER